MSIALFLSMIASVFLSFSIPVFFWGRFGYKTKGFFSSVIIGAAAYLIYFLIIRTSALSLTASLHIFPASLLRAIFFSLGLTLMNFIAYKMLKMTGRDLRCSYAVGVGTALAENAVVVGMAYINNIFACCFLLQWCIPLTRYTHIGILQRRGGRSYTPLWYFLSPILSRASSPHHQMNRWFM